jgi:hypothetical protein
MVFMSETTVSCDQRTKGRIKRLVGEMGEAVAEHAADRTEGSDEEMDLDEFAENTVGVNQAEVVDLATRLLDKQDDKRELMLRHLYGDEYDRM